jgi:transposase-like protein
MKPKGSRLTFAARLTQAEREKIVTWTREGLSRKEIATRLGTCEATVTLIRKRFGILTQPRKLDAKARREIIRLHGEGLGSRKISQLTKFGRVTVMKVLKAAGFTLKHGGPFLLKSKRIAVEQSIRRREDFACKLARKHRIGTETARRYAHKILGNGKLSSWHPLESEFPQPGVYEKLTKFTEEHTMQPFQPSRLPMKPVQIFGPEEAIFFVGQTLDKYFGGELPEDFITFAETLTEKYLQAIPRDTWNSLIPHDQNILRNALAIELLTACNTFRIAHDEETESALWAS